jgi:glycyl-tRNA synthetase alpha chain
VDSIYDIVWARDPQSGSPVKYRDVRYQDELQMSVYNFQAADVELLWSHFNQYEVECRHLIEGFQAAQENKADVLVRLGLSGLVNEQGKPILIENYPLLAAYELCLKCSHLFNLLDARGAISVTERVGVIARIRQLAVGLAKAYVAQQNIGGEAAKQQKGGAA